MADNVAITEGSGKNIAADDIGGVLHQRVKVTVGADGTNDGDVSSANPLPVSVSGSVTVDGSGSTQPVSGTVTANLSAVDNAVLDQIELNQDSQTTLLTTIDADTSALAATDFATEAKQDDIITAIGAIPGGGGTQYTEGDIDASITGTAMLWEDGSNTLRAVSVAKPLPMELVATGVDITLAANSGVDVGDVTINNATGAAAVNIQDGGNTITVDGTVDLGATDNAVLDAIAASVAAIDTDATTIIGHVDGIETLIGTTNTTLTTIDGRVDGLETLIGTTNTTLGTIDADTGAIATSLGSLDNAVDGNYLNVNVNVAGTDAVSGSGTATGALRVELPTNGTGVIATVGAVTAITNALPAGTNAIGKLSANSGVDIGDVDVTSVPRSLSGPGQPGTAIDSYTSDDVNLAANTANQSVIAAQALVSRYGSTAL